MDLSRLVAPEGEKTMLMLGETHRADELETMLAILEQFQPTAIAVEDRLEPLVKGVVTRLREIRRETFTELPPVANDYAGYYQDPTTIAMVYAARHAVPLYFIDHQPFSPLEVKDIFTSTLQEPTYKAFCQGLEDTITALCGAGAHEKARDEDIYTFYSRHGVTPYEVDAKLETEAMVFRGSLPASDAEAAALHARYMLSPQGIAARNQYSALALNNLQEERILYVGGHIHFSRKGFDGFDFFVPLQELVDAPNRHYISMKSLSSRSIREEVLKELGADEFPAKITKTVKPCLSHEVFK